MYYYSDPPTRGAKALNGPHRGTSGLFSRHTYTSESCGVMAVVMVVAAITTAEAARAVVVSDTELNAAQHVGCA